MERNVFGAIDIGPQGTRGLLSQDEELGEASAKFADCAALVQSD